MDEYIENLIRRAKVFYSTPDPGHFLINVSIPTECQTVPLLYDFYLDKQLTEWLDYKLEPARLLWRAKEGLDDDSIPSICPQFGI